MWRIALIMGLICSVALNVYLFLQLNMNEIETSFQHNLNLHTQQRAQDLQKNNKNVKAKTKAKTNSSEDTQNAQHIVNRIKNALNGKNYSNANFLIHTLANDQHAELSEIRLYWLQATKTLIQQKLFTQAEDAINAYLAFHSDDTDFLYQQVDLYWQQQLPLLAIKHAYEVQYHLYNRAEVHEAVNVARGLVQQQVDVLIKNNHWLELRNLIEEVLLFDAESLKLQWVSARAQYQLGEFEYARHAIEPLLNQPNYNIKARALLADIEAALRKPQSIPLSRQGEHFIVQALMNDTFNVSLMLDTGASISLLSESAFDELSQYSDVVYIQDLNLNTAGGTVTASIYQVAEFSIQDYVVNDFIFAVSPSYVNDHNDGLLGMNFLKAFDFHIDQNNGLLILKNK
ncbi:MAG: clan AA aspartic protease [Saccharospirillaceae bacterium]|nr:clan AA aspartic protease [Colwellia sp.]NRB77614.1 clan AA aspartic protease [Saccharospirillaceae bacterium]